MTVCDELGNCYDDGTGDVGSGVLDSGNPCDPTSVAYDPIACANNSGGSFGPQGGDTTPGIGSFASNVDATEVSWCQANPGLCDYNGVTAANINQFCQDNPASCNTGSDGFLAPTTGAGATNPKPGSVAIPTVGTGATGTGTGFLGGLTSFLNGLFQTCPAGYVRTANGQCVAGSTVNRGVVTPGLNQGFLGGISIGTIAIIVIVLLLISRKK